MIEARWIADETEAARLQSEGWRPSRGALAMHHCEHAMLLVRDVTDEETGEAA